MMSGGFAFLMALFEVYMVMVQFPSREKAMGSTAFVLWMLAVNGLVNVVYLVMMYIQYLTFNQMAYFMPNTGLWPLVMVNLTLHLLADPQGSTSFWGLAQIPNKWYPLALVGIFSLINGFRIMWDFVAALIVGYGYAYAALTAWVPATTTPGYGADAGDRRYATLSDFGRTSGQQLTAQGRNTDQGRQSGSGSSGSGGGGFQAFSG
eukprot:CAMPEP_0115564522 /NCGR_PEP_ID=MMETSP0271-20121206/102597_1 /TAXON_ID=71861 /ORGANISM="Scrippsiella trochoidea, Strain CCMP3099" /LENGTH=205 /DNA_ID=CAMNT_0002998771 /DNA_START=201 /DNA_END=815 /DNA_ORIENTATION=+